jgi:hypothetical protein
MTWEEDYEPANDYEDQMDGVRLGLYDHDDVHCKHGTFVGGWAGPDYMCGYCEDGISDEEWEASQRSAERRNRRVTALQPKLVEIIRDINLAAKTDPASDEVGRLSRRLSKYICWRVRAPFDIVQMVQEEKDRA